MKRSLALAFALVACLALATGCAAASSPASSSSTSSAAAMEAPSADAVAPESEWGTLFAVVGDDAVVFGRRVQSELPVVAFAEYDGVASGEPVEFADPGQIRALFNALAQSSAVEGAGEVRTDDYTRFWFVFADGSRQSFPFDSMTIQKTTGNSYVFYTVEPTGDLAWFADAAKSRFLEG